MMKTLLLASFLILAAPAEASALQVEGKPLQATTRFDSAPGLIAWCGAGENQCIFISPYGVDSKNSLGVWLYNPASRGSEVLHGLTQERTTLW